MSRDFEDHAWKDVMFQADLELYTPYRREAYIGKRPALLAIDLYNMVYQGGAKPVHEVAKEFPRSCGEYAWNAIEPTKQLFAMSRARGFSAFYTTGEQRPEARPGNIRATKRSRTGSSGENPQTIFEAFTPQFEDTVIIAGESTSGCVRASVADAYNYGFHVVAVEECCFDRNLLSHKVNLFDMHDKYAGVMHFDEIAEHLEAFPEA
jgi:maleamate amidohydrolase